MTGFSGWSTPELDRDREAVLEAIGTAWWTETRLMRASGVRGNRFHRVMRRLEQNGEIEAERREYPRQYRRTTG